MSDNFLNMKPEILSLQIRYFLISLLNNFEKIQIVSHVYAHITSPDI